MRNENLLFKILDKCMQLNNLGQDTFFRFSGHVEEIVVEVFKGKWKEIDDNKYADYEEMFLANYRLQANAYATDTEKLKKIIKKLNEIIDEVRMGVE